MSAAMLRDDLMQVRAPGVCFHVLKDAEGLYLIDAGFLGGQRLLKQALRSQSWEQPIKGIIVTHGHLDHILNVAPIVKESGAWVAAPQLDARHYEGNYPYRGLARVCGILEAAGRKIFRYEPFVVNRWLEDGTEIPIWHGLRAVHLPGHTDGHMGLYCEKLKLLFCADLFATHGPFSHLSPAIFNSDPRKIPDSVDRALELDLEGVIPNHCDKAAPVVQLERLRRLQNRLRTSTATR